MASLRLLIVAVAIGGVTPAKAQSVAHWRAYIEEAATRFGLPESWVADVMRAESGGRTHVQGRPIVSGKGAIGLMQLMPRTWAEMREIDFLGPNPHDPRDNILAGAAYLRLMYDEFGYPGLFAAYHAGPSRYRDFLTGRSLPPETVRYSEALSAATANRRPATTMVLAPPQQVRLFVELRHAVSEGNGAEPAAKLK